MKRNVLITLLNGKVREVTIEQDVLDVQGMRDLVDKALETAGLSLRGVSSVRIMP